MANAIKTVSSILFISGYQVSIVSDFNEPKVYSENDGSDNYIRSWDLSGAIKITDFKINNNQFKNTETWRSNGKRRKPRIK